MNSVSSLTLQQKEASALTIQTMIRSYQAQKAFKKVQGSTKEVDVYFLTNKQFEKAKHYMDSRSNYGNLPQANAGKTKTYLPNDLPIVLKHTGVPKNKERFEKMNQARQILDSSGYKHLVIPAAKVYSDFIVESRLPIKKHNTKEQIGFYIENQDKFTDAVIEFTGFLCQCYVGDIINGSNDPYQTLFKIALGRYDNVPLYLEDGKGKIGLIDLETFDKRIDLSQLRENCNTAVCLFPYHLEAIIDAAKKFDPSIEDCRESLERFQDGALKGFKLAYENHLGFVKSKEIVLQDPLRFDAFDGIKIEEIKEIIEKAIWEKHNENWGEFSGCLGENPDATLSDFHEKVLPKFLEAANTLIEEHLKENLREKKGCIASSPELLSLRTVKIITEF